MKVSYSILLVAVLALSLGTVAVAGDDATHIGTDHDLDSDWAVNEYAQDGHVEGDIDVYDARIAVADDLAQLDADPALSDIGSDWVQIQYSEGLERDLVIHLPDDYAQPYERNGVESVTSEHVASFDTAGDYLEIRVSVDGPATITLPLQWDGQVSYGVIDRAQERVDRVTDPFTSDANWTVYDSTALENETAVLVANHTDVLVQRDAATDSPDRRWIPADKDDADAPVYFYAAEEDGEWRTYVVATEGEPPAVRVTEEPNRVDELWHEIQSAREIPNRLTNLIELPEWVPVVG